MNPIRIFTFALSLLATSLCVAAEAPRPQAMDPNTASDSVRFTCRDSTSVVVRSLEGVLPVGTKRLKAFLWDNFMNSSEAEAFTCPVRGWRERWAAFSRSLVRQADALSLDGRSLERCLDHVYNEREKNAYVPIGAYRSSYKGEPVWIVVVKWEWADASYGEVLGHARVYVLNAKSTLQVAFVTCD
jgi:hypothetical protein